MVGYSSPKEYLKHLKIQRNSVNKFRVNYANHNSLTKISKLYLDYLDKEIEDVENSIAIYKLKQSNNQVNIYNFIDKE